MSESPPDAIIHDSSNEDNIDVLWRRLALWPLLLCIVLGYPLVYVLVDDTPHDFSGHSLIGQITSALLLLCWLRYWFVLLLLCDPFMYYSRSLLGRPSTTTSQLLLETVDGYVRELPFDMSSSEQRQYEQVRQRIASRLRRGL